MEDLYYGLKTSRETNQRFVGEKITAVKSLEKNGKKSGALEISNFWSRNVAASLATIDGWHAPLAQRFESLPITLEGSPGVLWPAET
jgi:hypothetical protein